MNGFDHFILTRFNVPLKFDLPPGQQPQHRGIEPGWLARRFDLFERVCLSSVQRQTQGAFQWLVFMDEATPLLFKDRMAALCRQYNFLHPVYCEQFSEAGTLAEIERRSTAGKIRITTRLDNDDAIHPRLIERVQQLASDNLAAQDLSRGFFISLPMGCAECNGDFYMQRYRHNPFTSFVSVPECAKTVLGGDHRYISEVAPVVFEFSRPMWCQIIHGENVANHVRGVYWPWGGKSEFAPVVLTGARRSVFWKVKEVARSAKNYLLHRQK